ncbi:hypothetical protein V2J09_014348 [Rumex salicifolius]
MAGESGKEVDVAEKAETPVAEEKTKDVTTTKKKKKKQRGFISRIWHKLFGSRDDDFGRRLERISKDEAAILSRMKRRSHSWGKLRKHLILFSVLLELIAVGYAIMTTASARDWRNRAFHVLPMFLLPLMSYVTYTTLNKYINMRERKDQKTLDKLREERQSKIDELKEKSNYYVTQQLIQRYDTDPAAKAAAATVLASKLGADSGLKLYVGDESKSHSETGRSNDVELVQQAGGLRNRKQPQEHNGGSNPALHHQDASLLQQMGAEIAEYSQPMYVDHYQQGKSDAYSGGFLARMAALLVGEDPTQSFALICGNCHMHNGLASKEDFPYLTYICPHCRAVNGPRKQDDHVSVIESSRAASLLTEDNVKTTRTVSESPIEGTSDVADSEQLASSPGEANRIDNAII